MNKYVRKLFGAMFQSQQTQQVVHMQPQHLPASPEEWRRYWQAQGQSWRTEPEIDVGRQRELSQRLATVPNIEQGIYPFKGMKLSRADVEWLLATHNQGQGPIPGEMEISGHARGLDLRGAGLCYTDLNRLPLVQLRGGLNSVEVVQATSEQREAAALHLEGATLLGADLRHATFRFSHLAGADLRFTQLEGAIFLKTHLAGNGTLQPADLRNATFDHDTLLQHPTLGDKTYGSARLADVHWGDANLAQVDWAQVNWLGDEHEARRSRTHRGALKSKEKRMTGLQEAVRANRQLAVALQNQGLNEEAARFAYRAQILQRKIFWMQRNIGKWLFSLLLAFLAGYGYRMWRILAAYLIVICACALAYFVLGMYYPTGCATRLKGENMAPPLQD